MRYLNVLLTIALATIAVACGGEDTSSSLDSNSIPPQDAGLTDADGDVSVDTSMDADATANTEVSSGDSSSEVDASQDPCKGKRQVKCYAWTCPEISPKDDDTYRVFVEDGKCKMKNDHGMGASAHSYRYSGGNKMKRWTAGDWVTCEGHKVKDDGKICSQAENGR